MAGSNEARVESSSPTYWRRVARALSPARMAIAFMLALLLSTRILVPSEVFDFYSATDIAVAWLEYLVELLPIAFGMTLVYTLADEALPLQGLSPTLRSVALSATLLAAALAFATLRLGLLQGFEHLSAQTRFAAPTLEIALPAIACAVIALIDRRIERTEAARRQTEAARAALELEDTELQLKALQAQIEPHFLFNTLANVRRLYRTRPSSGASMIASLMCYLHLVLPQMRRPHSTLGDELALVRAYLELFQVRMGQRLSYEIDVSEPLADLEFPPMLLLTLAENAIKHGVDPSVDGGRVRIAARRFGAVLEVAVDDDGVGFGMAPSSGTGVGLANIRRQLAARYGAQGLLELSARVPRGVSAAITIPAARAAAASPVRAEAATLEGVGKA